MTNNQRPWLIFAGGTLLVSLCGLILGESFLGQSWADASYDYLFRFGTRPVTNNVVVILMDNISFDQFHQTRGQPWDRGLHAQLLNRLADDHCRLVVMDSFFRQPNNPEKDAALATAMKRQPVILMAEQAQVEHPDFTAAQPILPCPLFLEAARTNWGVAWFDKDLDQVVRRHWPFPSPGPYPSLAETAAKCVGATPDQYPHERWLRYYGQNGAWTHLSYASAMTQSAGYFRDKIVFIGIKPSSAISADEVDQFQTPFTRWTGESIGGVEINITEFLNLMNHDWLWRPPIWLEFTVFIVAGILGGAGLCRLKFYNACICVVSGALILTLAAVSLSYITNIWFPWLAMVGGQIPCALAWVAIAQRLGHASGLGENKPLVRPKIPGFKLFHPPFGEGAYGKVWLTRKKSGEWCAVKVIFRSNFAADSVAYEREFTGVSTYKSLSDQHPGLLRVDFVSQKTDEFFYYVMELGDALDPAWQKKPAQYAPRDLAGERARLAERRLPVRDCVHIGLKLSEALDFLHQRGLTHRDIKPQNIIFVNGQPKLADFGLMRIMRPADETKTFVGTPGYMPPPPEPPGTLQADIYALGMVLYVICTGRDAASFPEIATNLMDSSRAADFLSLNAIILKACDARLDCRYLTAREMFNDLNKLAGRWVSPNGNNDH